MERIPRVLAALLLATVSLDQLYSVRAESNSSQLVGAQVYERINDLLAGSSTLEDKLETLVQERSRLGGDPDGYFAKTLKTFADLKELVNGSSGLVGVPIVGSDNLASMCTCNHRGYEILHNAYKALSSYKDEPRQIELLVNECAVKHAKFCSKVYIKGFNEEHSALSRFYTLRNSLSTIFAKIKSQEEPPISRDLDHIYAHKMVYYRSGDAKLYYDALVEMAAADDHPFLRHLFAEVDEATGKSDYSNMINAQRIKLILSNYFVNPCAAYMSKFGPDYFVPIALDYTVLAPSERFDEKDVGSELVKKFVEGWRDYRLCRNVVKDYWQEKVVQGIASIVYHEIV